jgi:hypothetical protein
MQGGVQGHGGVISAGNQPSATNTSNWSMQNPSSSSVVSGVPIGINSAQNGISTVGTTNMGSNLSNIMGMGASQSLQNQ